MTVSAFLDYFSLSRWLADTILVRAGWVVSEAPLASSPSARRDCETRNCARLSESFATSLPPRARRTLCRHNPFVDLVRASWTIVFGQTVFVPGFERPFQWYAK